MVFIKAPIFTLYALGPRGFGRVLDGFIRGPGRISEKFAVLDPGLSLIP